MSISQTSKKPPEVQVMEMMRKSMKRCCMHPDQAQCKGKIKEAHALQNNKIISLLAGNERHVYMMNSKKQPLIIPMKKGDPAVIVEMSRTSANDATTETCFCDLHDNTVFAAIEKGEPDFDESNEVMKFVYAYKSFIFEYYKQSTAINIFKKCGSIIFLVGLAMPHYRLLIPSASLDMNLRQCFRVITPTATNSGIACFLTPRRAQAS